MRRINQHITHIFRITICTLLAAILFLSCNKENAPDCLQSAGEYTEVIRELDAFSSIELNDYILIELFDTTDYRVEIHAPKNLIPDIETSVAEGKLTVRNNNHCNFIRSFKKEIKIRICAPSFSDIQNKGTGDITSVNTIDCSYFKIENHHAAGVIRIDLNTDSTLIATHTGVSDCYLSGKSTQTSLFNQGLGVIDARNLISEFSFVNNSSINDVYVHSNDYLFATLFFSGNIYYRGAVSHIDQAIHGNGQLIRLN